MKFCSCGRFSPGNFDEANQRIQCMRCKEWVGLDVLEAGGAIGPELKRSLKTQNNPPTEINMKMTSLILEQIWRNVKWPLFEQFDGNFTKPVTKNYKVSICTTCQDRLSDLKQTLPKNIQDNLDYPNVEFVLLDYNSTKDDIEKWVKDEMMGWIEMGVLNFYRTDEPKYYDMSHSRNIAFLAASGEIVNNVDADAYTNKGFATFLNRLANEQPKKAMFAKSKQLLRGRLGFYKKEFIEILGGYDEINCHGYGHDDQDLMNRAFEIGMKMMAFRAPFVGIVDGHVKKQPGRYREGMAVTEARNRFISYVNLILGKYKANQGFTWGQAKLVKNFKYAVETGRYWE